MVTSLPNPRSVSGEIVHGVGREEIVVCGEMALDRGGEPAPIRLVVAEWSAVVRRDGRDAIPFVRGEHEGQHPAHAEADHTNRSSRLLPHVREVR